MRASQCVRLSTRAAFVIALLHLAACTSMPGVDESGARPRDIPIGTGGPVQGVGIAGRDIAAMTNQMARDLLSSVAVMGQGRVPRIIIDSSHFDIQGSQPLNRDLISQRLLVELNRAAAGRIAFVGRRHLGMVDEERAVTGKRPSDDSILGADFRLAGTFGTLDSYQASSGVQQRYNQVVFELVELTTSHVVWSGIYEVERAGADDIVYR
jgi:hypothetical protein